MSSSLHFSGMRQKRKNTYKEQVDDTEISKPFGLKKNGRENGSEVGQGDSHTARKVTVV